MERLTRRATGAALVIVAGVMFAAPGLALAQVSPGPLAKPHAELEGLRRCNDCHAPGEGVSPDRCLACHTPLKARIEAKRGYHPRAIEDEPRCEACHMDHVTREFELIAWPDDDPERFDHTKGAGFELTAAHAALRCRDCHKPDLVRDPLVREVKEKAGALDRTYLGLGTDCASCHDDPHRSELGADCASCHGEATFRPADRFDHAAVAPLEGAHASAACVGCHRAPDGAADATGLAALRWRGVERDRCVACHADPHRGEVSTDCASCHDQERFAGAKRFDHARTDFPLRGAHERQDCAACHVLEGRPAAPGAPFHEIATFTPVAHESCVSCHLDVHAGQLGADCASCHTEASFGSSAFTRDDHADRAGFALRGGHEAASCASCHGAALDRPVAEARCASCHDDGYHLAALGNACAECHTATTWPATTYDRGAHAPQQLPLAGAHATAACASCHELEPASAASAPADPADRASRLLALDPVTPLPRTEATHPSGACASCHADPHAARFGADCASCHDARGWKTIAAGAGSTSGFSADDHQRTRYPLEGAHATTACTACHGEADGGGLRTLAPLPFDACVRCHEDAHRGELPATRAAAGAAARAIAADCEACHTVAAFSPSTFDRADHAAAGFDLAGAHAAADCAGCHRPRGRELTLRPAAADCNACHDDPHRRQFTTRPAAACASCHPDGAADWGAPGFDHGATAMPLRGAHAAADCATCHVLRAPLAGAAPYRHYRGVSADCAHCHQDPHLGQFRAGEPVRACTACHDDSRFRPAVGFDHARMTTFPLDGKHAAAACAACHDRVELGPGLATIRYRATPSACATCHRDEHEGSKWRRR